MGYRDAVIISYLFQLPLGYYAMFRAPLRGELGDFFERARNATIVAALVPVPFLMILLQAMWLGMYLSKAKLVERRTEKVNAQWQGGSRPASNGNPFGGDTERPRSSPASPEPNPFGGEVRSQDESGVPPPARNNPFA